jgi:drug/metabolite transporter (DMT)-like permease
VSTPTSSSAHWRAIALLAFCSVLWSIAGVFTRHLEQAQSFEVTFWRSFFCFFAVVALTWQRTRANPWIAVKAMGWAGLFSGVMWAIMFTCFMVALTRTSTANTLLVSSISPLLAAVLAWAILKQRLALGTWIAILMAIAGIWWMVREGVSAQGLSGMAIALGVPIAAALNLVMLKKMHASVDLAPAVLVGAVISALGTLPWAMPFQASWHDVGILAFLGVFQLAVPCFLMLRAVPHLAPHEIALISMLEVVLGPIWAWWGAGEVIGASTWQGGLLVIGALVTNELLQRWRPAQSASTI